MNVKRFIHIWTIAILFLLLDVNIAKAASSCPLDSVLTFNVDSVLTEVTIYDYDDAGHTISEVVWTVNPDGSRIGKSKKEDQYEGNTQVMTSTYVWDNTTSNWKGSAKTEYEFTNGKNTATTVYDWPNNTWSAKSKETYVYDGAGRETEYTTYSRNSSGQLVYAKRREKTYNIAGKLILDIIYNSYANGAWVGSSKYVYDYNASGTQTLYEYYSSYTNGAWVGSTREVYEYDAAGNKTLEEKYSGMSGGKWKGSSKYTATFNTNNKETEHIAYKWNTTSKNWQNNKKTTKAYDGNNVTDEASYTWSSNNWVGSARTSKTYSGTLVTSEIVWKWSNGWVHNTKTENQYVGSSSNISVQTKFAWKNSAWVNVSQLTNTYVSNRLTEANTKAWRNGAWQDSLRVTHGFNAKGIDTLAITSTWNNSAWIPKDSTTREVTYIKIGSKDYVTEDVSMKWTSASGKWTGVKRETKEYDTSGNVIQSDTYTFVSGTGWVNNVRNLSAYKDGNSKYPTLNASMIWDKTNNVWTGVSKTEKEYDASNRQVKTSTYSWNTSHNDWAGSSSTEDIYENGIKVTSYSYTWDNTDWQWIGMFKHDYTYSGSKIIEQIDWRYNKTTGWYYDTKLTNTYDSKGRTIQTVNYQWIAADSQWCMTSTNQTTYDAEADGGRLREQLNATGSNCAVTSYALKHYMYGCDQITIRFVNYDGTVLDTQILEKGVTPVYNGATPTREGGPDNSYTFIGWTPEIVPVNGNATYTATYASSTNSYTITWLNDDGTTIDQTTLDYGVMPTHADATKVNTAEYTYEFIGWTPGLGIVTGDATYQATFKSTKNKYIITWRNDDNTQIDQTSVEYGVVPTHDDPSKAATAEFTYTFAGWDNAPIAVTGPATYKATYTSTKNKYTITWLDDDNSSLGTTSVEYGIVPTHENPTKAATAEFTYTFAGWDNTPIAVTGPATYKATYTSTKNKYTITWLDDDNSSLGTTTVEYGVVPTHADPTKQPTAQYGYTFAGWSPAITSVTGNATYKATYTDTINQYTISWLDDTGTLVDQTKVAYGSTPAHANIYKESDDQFDYTFVGWTPTLVPVTGDASYSAIFTTAGKSYTVTFYFEDGVTILDQMTLPYGAIPSTPYIPSIPSDANHTYTFSGWSPEIAPVTGDISYVPTFTAIPNQYIVIFRNYNGKELQRKKVDYGTIPEYEGDEPSRPATNSYTWAFEGWTPELTAVIGDATYTAVYIKVMNTYTILFYDEDGTTLLAEVTVEHGQKPTTSVVPTKEADEEYIYTFAGWSPKIAKATADAEYTATYMATPKTQDLNNTEAEERATKVLIDDHIYILRSGHTYTLDGALVK